MSRARIAARGVPLEIAGRFTDAVSNVGGWMQAVAQGGLVYRLTDLERGVPFMDGVDPEAWRLLDAGLVRDTAAHARAADCSFASLACWRAYAASRVST